MSTNPDEHANNLIAAGALFILLNSARVQHSALTDVAIPGDEPSNQIDVRFSFLNSAYRLTVERMPDEDQP